MIYMMTMSPTIALKQRLIWERLLARGRISDLTLTTGDEDWYKAYFPNDGTPDQFITSVFDHQEGDIDIEIYDANNTLLRSSNSVTDDETIYLSDIAW